MTFEELLEHLRFEYHGYLAAEYQHPWSPRLREGLEKAPTFYEFLVARGFNRHKLAAHGIRRDVQA